ncbi:DeoR/GlpR family DNA-binding transcription regulator [Tatumella sp. UBA2305]|uniref:DeoR/GlpR family DNA-binding transcription regulator n=1 Tax=Tatumella sp. UBA2305 TaxID=1947647 RepID=UPI0025DD0C1A|nr:DeoR/GlpR family DNA-binding transcription regulator [Tatumella sp. UBA2305]
MPRKSSNLLKRRLKIAELVGEHGEIKVEDLSALLGVSGVTIRGDLSYLEQQGYLKRSFGGAIATPAYHSLSTPDESPLPVTGKTLTLAQQLEIARHCARTISPFQTVFLGEGSVIRRVIPFLSEFNGLKLIVNDLHHALLAEQYIEGDIIVAGDELMAPLSLLAGNSLEECLSRYTVDHFIFEAGIRESDGGLMVSQPLLSGFYQAGLNSAQQSTVIITGQPARSDTPSTAGYLAQASRLVTSRFIQQHYQPQLSEAGFSIQYSNNECFSWSATP